MPFARMSDGQVLPASKINELQVGLENLDSTHYTAATIDSLISGITQDVDARVELFPFLSGQYYSTFSHGLGRSSSGTMGNLAVTVDRIVAVPIHVPHDTTFDKIGIHVTVAVASALTRLAIATYDWSTRVATRVIDAGAIDASTTGFKELTISQFVTAGTYWLMMNNSHAISVMGEVPVRGFGISTATGNILTAVAKTSATYGAFGATETLATFLSGTACPHICVRVA